MKHVAAWARPFDDPVLLPDGRELVTLHDAGDYITSLPKAEQNLDAWQAAVEALLLVVELNGPTMMARIGVMRALNRHVERVFDPSRKDKPLGRRKPKREPMTTRSGVATPSWPYCLESDLAKREYRQQLCCNIHSAA